MNYFLCKLIAPRPTFAQDMTPAEARIMQEHGAYWADLANRSVAVVFGLVADPKGAWGLGIVEVESEEHARALTGDDPTIKSGLDFRFEIYPMPRATSRK